MVEVVVAPNPVKLTSLEVKGRAAPLPLDQLLRALRPGGRLAYLAGWQKHLQSADHRECVLVPRPLPPERVRSTDLDDRNLGLADGESVVFHRPDGPWIGLASLGDGATLRTEGPQRGIVLDRLGRQLGPDAAPTKHLCLRCGLILDPVILGHHTTSREHRAHKDPWLEPAVQREAARAATVEPEPRAPDVRSSVTMEPLLISVADAARILGLSRSMIGELALKGIIPSLRVGSRVLVLVKALEEWIEARLAEDAERFAASWSRLRSHVTPARSLSNGRGAPQRRRPRWLHSAEIVSVCPDPAIQ